MKPTIETATKMAEQLKVSLVRIVDHTDLELDKKNDPNYTISNQDGF